jgi:hypothetical protein
MVEAASYILTSELAGSSVYRTVCWMFFWPR